MRSTHSTPAPRIVYQSERITVTRISSDDFELELDGQFVHSFRSQAQAEHEGAMLLEQDARQLTADLADEAAARDAVDIPDEPQPPTPGGPQPGPGPGGIAFDDEHIPVYRDGMGFSEWHGAQAGDPVLREAGRRIDAIYARHDARRRERDILAVDLAALRACVEQSVTIGALAAIVQSGVYLHSRGLLVDRPEQPDWALVAAVETIIGRAA